ncbi:hypothetical protein SDRG_14054 [Saprolegnia diclina VS20]|uniref:Uncharacterized protein n=1 Tax=Saprolegnia diclina (strain VS20) TaxID=1156394 RepID=T0Q468_SAPDV|nr:hypothetical protein SDRG_14054 [Saprolegnia diclina VS20]EQC28230.1 hypothetical protein SDRG_14054 [Saprolegnia diclina VS20]|eukprot:XP_008618379.1 hypothetical protein SDRG_14054 [Saprolegnia diclina VS20]
MQQCITDVYLRYVIPLKDYLMLDCLGGPRPVQVRKLLNAQKAATVVVLPLLMWYFGNWSTPAYLHLANHGTFGVFWVVKDVVTPDKVWAAYMTLPSALLGVLVLSADWAADYCIIANHVEPAPGLVGFCTALHTTGLTLLMCTDTQKYFVLRSSPGVLFTDGYVKWSRNPNFLGKLLVYLSYAVLADHWFPYAMLTFMTLFVMLSHMILKDISLAKKPGGEAYLARTGLLLPNVLGWLRTDVFPHTAANDAPVSPSVARSSFAEDTTCLATL